MEQSSLRINVVQDGVSIGTSGRTPVTATVQEAPRLNPKVQTALRRAWEKVEQDFFRDSGGLRLGQVVGGKDGVMEKWRQIYKIEDADDGKRSREMQGILSNVLAGIEIVGAFAAQAASTVWGPAQMCFNAVQFLIDIPKTIKKVYNGLRELFQEIEQFLLGLRVYQRIDDKFGLDEELVVNLNDLLISFVRICGLSTKMLQGGTWSKFKIGLKAVLGDDNGVGAELDSFRRLTLYQSTATETITLEHVLESEEHVKQILTETAYIRSGMNTLLAIGNDEKTRYVNRDRLSAIEKKLFKQPPPTEEKSSEDILPGTLEALQAIEAYQTWQNKSTSEPSNSVLILSGPTGSGKSQMIDSIKEYLDSMRNKAAKEDASIYVAAYNFADNRARKAKDKKNLGSLVSHALKVIALQVAGQSTVYAKDLSLQLQKQDKAYLEEDIQKVWELLRLDKITVPGSKLYILFDAVHEESDKGLKTFLTILADSQADRKSGSLEIRVLLATNDSIETIERKTNRQQSLAILANEINKKLVLPFLNKEIQMMKAFRGSDSYTRQLKQKVSKLLTADVDDTNFNDIRRKLRNLQEAVDSGRPRSVIESLLTGTNYTASEEEAEVILRGQEDSLSSNDVALLNRILSWLLGLGYEGVNVVVIEAALSLEQASLPIESLAKSIAERFSKILILKDDKVWVEDNIREYLVGTEGRSKNKSIEKDRPMITLDISVRSSSIKMVKQFIWDLNEQMVNDKFDFGSAKTTVQGIQYDNLISQLTITRLCFELMNQGWNTDTKIMLSYAVSWITLHLLKLQQMEDSVSVSDRKMIGEGLVTFLTDPYNFEQEHVTYGQGIWILYDEQMAAVRFWLEDPETLRQLSPKEQRWVKQATNPSQGPVGFLLDQASWIGRRWLTDHKSNSYEMFDWIDSYLLTVDRLNTIPANAISEEAAGDPEEVEQGEMSETKDGSEAIVGQDQIGSHEGEGEKSNETNDNETNGPNVQEDSPNPDIIATEIAPALTDDCSKAQAEQVEEVTSVPVDGTSGDTEQHPEQVPTLLVNGEDGVPVEVETNGETSPPPDEGDYDNYSDDDRIMVAVKWITSQQSLSKDAAYYLTIGNAYYSSGNTQRALVYFELGLKESSLRHYLLHRVGVCYMDTGDKIKALEHADEGMDIFARLAEAGELDECDTDEYFDYLEYWAGKLQEHTQHQRALEFQEKAFKLKPNDIDCRWTTLQMRCMADDLQDSAVELLRTWADSSDEVDSLSPALSLLGLIEDNNYEASILPIIRNIKSKTLRLKMLEIAAEAIGLADEESADFVHSTLFHLQGSAYIMSSESEVQAQAADCWKKCLNALPQKDEEYSGNHWLLKQASWILTQTKFEELLNRQHSNPDLTFAEKANMRQELQDYFARAIASCATLEDVKGIHTAESYIIAFCAQSGMLDEARQLCKPEMADALEILSDEDLQNDNIGLEKLTDIFYHLCDRANALTAFSLLDRDILRRRKAGGITTTTTDVETPSMEEKSNGGYARGCNYCGETIYSSDTDGMWACQFCPWVDFCPACKVKHETGTVRQERCGPSHTPHFIHLYHVDYTDEELEGTKVLVGWKYKDDGDGKFSRVGGELVEMSEWIEKLRLEWNLPKQTGSSSRAQQ